MHPLLTRRLQLVPATANLTRLEITDPDEFFDQLGVRPIADWPSDNVADALPLFLDQLEGNPSWVGWMSWYWIDTRPQHAELVGGGGFKGPPVAGAVEIGYETRPRMRHKGFATEAMGRLVDWALRQPNVARVVAETQADNVASQALLRRLRFARIHRESEEGMVRFEKLEPHG